MKSCISRTALLLQAIAVAGAIGLAWPASVALAQGGQSERSQSGAAASKPGSVAGVVVQAPHRRPRIPPDKAAAFDVEAAKRQAWNRYRKSTPPASAGAMGQLKDYPGLRSLDSH